MNVAVRSAGERREVERRLAELGIVPVDGAHLPPELRDRIVTFVAPERMAFEMVPKGTVRDGKDGSDRSGEIE